MNTSDDRFFDELGVAWRAVNIDTAALERRIHGQLRREWWHRRLGVAVVVIAGTIGVIFSVALIRTHEAVWQRAGAVCLAALVVAAAAGAWIYRSPLTGDTENLIGMLELAASQTKARRREAWVFRYLGPALILLAFGAVLYAARPRGAPLANIVIVALAGSAFMSFEARRHYRTYLEQEKRLLHLKYELTTPEHKE